MLWATSELVPLFLLLQYLAANHCLSTVSPMLAMLVGVFCLHAVLIVSNWENSIARARLLVHYFWYFLFSSHVFLLRLLFVWPSDLWHAVFAHVSLSCSGLRSACCRVRRHWAAVCPLVSGFVYRCRSRVSSCSGVLRQAELSTFGSLSEVFSSFWAIRDASSIEWLNLQIHEKIESLRSQSTCFSWHLPN